VCVDEQDLEVERSEIGARPQAVDDVERVVHEIGAVDLSLAVAPERRRVDVDVEALIEPEELVDVRVPRESDRV
jgi:hypothetical protein